jgi:hypothetical protein
MSLKAICLARPSSKASAMAWLVTLIPPFPRLEKIVNWPACLNRAEGSHFEKSRVL